MKHLFIIWGKVRSGKKRGRQLGFPTANITLHRRIPEGIYAAEVVLDGKVFKAATFIGPAKTFGENDTKAESYMFDFNKDIYNRWITVRLYKKIRENRRFQSEAELVTQMQQDIKVIEEYFKVI